MASLNASLILMLLFELLGFNSEAAPTYSSHYCDTSTSFTPNSSYQANINTLFSSLSSNSGISKNGFFNTTAGQAPNLVYGTFLCRGDVSANLCRDCVATATKDIAQRCLAGKTGVIWYDECTVRYSDQDIFSIMREVPGIDIGSSVTIPDKDLFNQLLSKVMNSLANRAAYDDRLAKKFATGVANFSSSFQTLYSLVQCTPDLTDALCFMCLQSAIATIPMCCDGKQGGRVLLPSCNIRYEMFPFYSLNGTGATVFPSAKSPPSSRKGKRGMSSQRVIEIVVPTVSLMAFLCCALGWKVRKKQIVRKVRNGMPKMAHNCISSCSNDSLNESIGGSKVGTTQQFDLSIIKAVTNNFTNKIGAGGFGTVYKGTLPNGEDIAVKRLSTSSEQGAEEFQTEVLLVARLQHRNLVNLIGYCLERKERMLIYEFVPNKSLDHFIFDPVRKRELNWSKRYKIIKGIARGLLYLHSDSHIKIIHRDLKAGNILLDEDMTPKISDFGMARIVGDTISLEQTKRIVGTYGYMSPEYAMNGRFSEKSDVFSFGILILEIVCGKKNTSFGDSEHATNLLTYAWKHWKDGTPLELLDSSLQDSYTSNEVVRCIQIGLLCVQDKPDARPTMARVVLMLNSSSVTLPSPQKTAFFFGTVTGQKFPVVDQSSYQSTTTSSSSATVNEASLTEPIPR